MSLPLMKLPMDIRDITLWESESLKGFALPLKYLIESEISFYGTTVHILEPFKRLTVQEKVEKDGKTIIQKTTVGVVYRSDNKVVWDNSRHTPPEKYEEVAKWSPAYQLPDYAVRRKAMITKSECAPIQSFTKEQIKLLQLDYESQGDSQLLMEQFAPHKDLELLYKWWKRHYKSTLRDNNNPDAVILYLTPTD